MIFLGRFMRVVLADLYYPNVPFFIIYLRCIIRFSARLLVILGKIICYGDRVFQRVY